MKKFQRAILVALDDPAEKDLEGILDELELILSNMGIRVFERVIQKRDGPDPAFLLGKGKAEELGSICASCNADLVVTRERLNATQVANLQKLTGREIWDKAFVIMKIFEARARTSEAKLQVELARCNYEIPFLKGLGKQMSRLGGGIGTRGPGETEFERHRRKLERKVRSIKKRLKVVEKRRDGQRKRREKTGMTVVSLTGYTNSGKSTLLRRLSSDSTLEADDRLFCTLDTFTRKVRIASNRDILLSDTVGFIQGLPPDLVTAFRTTLEEITWSDALLLVIDASSPSALDHFNIVQETLHGINASLLPRIVVLNKIDTADSVFLDSCVERLEWMGEKVVPVSATEGAGIDRLKESIADLLFYMNK